jgi:transposase
MASLIAKKRANTLYYYVVESARVDGKPRIVHQTYLGTAERVAALIKDSTAPVPLSATSIAFGLPGALWLTAERSGAFAALTSLWPTPRSGPSTAHYLLLAAIHRICEPGPKTEVADWYRHSVLHSLWGFPPERFTSQAFWDCFDQIESAAPTAADQLQQAQTRLLGAWKDKQLISRRLLAYDTTNFHTYIASTNQPNQLAQRGHNKQGRHNLRQVGLSYVLDGESGLSLCHHVYPGNLADANELPVALERIGSMLDEQSIARDAVTLVLDKGSAALANTLALDQAGVGWISALPWNQAPQSLRELPCEKLAPLGGAHPGIQAMTAKDVVHGREYLCVVVYSAVFASEQLHRITATLTKVMQAIRRLACAIAKPESRFTEEGIQRKLRRWLATPYLSEILSCELKPNGKSWDLRMSFDHAALPRLLEHRLGRTTLLTNRLDWTAEQVVDGYLGQQRIERVFRGLKEGDWLRWGPMYHWTDSKIRVHAFYCLLGISLLQSIHRQAQTAWPGISMEKLIDELGQIQQYQLLYPAQGSKGPGRVATVLSKQSIPQHLLADTLGLDQLGSGNRG